MPIYVITEEEPILKKSIAKMISLILCIVFVFGVFPVNNALVEANAGTTLYWPVPGHYSLSRTFAQHGGQAIDISDGSINGSPVVAAIGGKVVYITLCPNNHWAEIQNGVNPGNLDCDGFGYGVIIHGDDGRWYQYAHMQAGSIPSYVYYSGRVNAGQQVGRVGNTGASSGPHLHFEINTSGMFAGHIDPMKETYGNVTAEVYFSSYPEKYSVTETDATLSTIISSNVSISSISTVGIILYDRNGTELARKSEKPILSGSQIKAWYYVNSELGYTLNPGTKYNYKFFSVIGSQTYYSDTYSFTTNGTCSHSYTTSVKDATCAQAGEKTSICTKCGYQKTESIPATGNHIWNSGVVTKEPTVSETGIKTYTCTVCGTTKTETLNKIPSGFGVVFESDGKVNSDGEIAVELYLTDCAGLGLWYFDIAYNNDDYSFIRIENGKDAAAVLAKDKSALANSFNDINGNIVMTGLFTDCLFTSEHFAQLNYSQVNGEKFHLVTFYMKAKDVADSLRMDLDGELTFFETVIDNFEYPIDGVFDNITANITVASECLHNGHTEKRNQIQATCKNSGYTGDVYCLSCNKMITKGTVILATENHSWNNGVVTKEPTVAETGIKTYTCVVCKDTKTDVIPKLDVPAADDAVVTVDTVTAKAGAVVKVEVNITKSAPLSYLRFILDYDTDVLTLQSVENGELFDTLDKGTSLVFSRDGDTDKTGKLMTLNFSVSDKAEAGDYTVKLSCREAYNFDEEDVSVGVNNGKITVAQYVLGDMNSDNEVNGKDLVRLRRFLADLDENTGASSVEIGGGSDVTGDGIVNGKDLVRIRKYLANFNEETGKSTVELG